MRVGNELGNEVYFFHVPVCYYADRDALSVVYILAEDRQVGAIVWRGLIMAVATGSRVDGAATLVK